MNRRSNTLRNAFASMTLTLAAQGVIAAPPAELDRLAARQLEQIRLQGLVALMDIKRQLNTRMQARVRTVPEPARPAGIACHPGPEAPVVAVSAAARAPGPVPVARAPARAAGRPETGGADWTGLDLC